FLATSLQGRGIAVWGLASGEELRTFDIGIMNAHGLTLSPDGQLLAAMVGQTIRIWDLSTGNELHDDAGHRGIVTGVAFLNGGTKLVTMGQDLTVRYWDANSGKELSVLRAPQYGGQSMAAEPNEESVLAS